MAEPRKRGRGFVTAGPRGCGALARRVCRAGLPRGTEGRAGVPRGQERTLPCLFRLPDCGPEEDDPPSAAQVRQERWQVHHHGEAACLPSQPLHPSDPHPFLDVALRGPSRKTEGRGPRLPAGSRCPSSARPAELGAWLPLPGDRRGHLGEQRLRGALLQGPEAG